MPCYLIIGNDRAESSKFLHCNVTIFLSAEGGILGEGIWGNVSILFLIILSPTYFSVY